jgi:hypothetical protein
VQSSTFQAVAKVVHGIILKQVTEVAAQKDGIKALTPAHNDIDRRPPAD